MVFDVIISLIFYIPWLVGAFVISLMCHTLWRQLCYDSSRVSDMSKKSVFITGCDTGFGNAIAKRFDSIGVKVFAGCYTEDGAKALQDSSSSNLVTVMIDVTDKESIDEAYDVIVQHLKLDPSLELWGLINNAGAPSHGGFIEWSSLEDYRMLYEVNTMGTVAVTKKFLPHIKNSKGRIMCMSSALGRLVLSGTSPYAVSKFGVEAFADAARREMEAFGVHCSLHEAEFYTTPITTDEHYRSEFYKMWNTLSDELKEDFGGEHALNKYIDRKISSMRLTRCSRLDHIADSAEHAMFSKRPLSRYMLGPRMLFLASWISLLPAEVCDVIVRLVAGPSPLNAKRK